MASTRKPGCDELTAKGRTVGWITSAILILVGFGAWCCPPTRSLTETNAEGKVIKAVNEQTDATTPSVVLIVGGLALHAFVLNGLRLSRISAGGVSAETLPSSAEIEDVLESDQAEQIDIDGQPPPESGAAPIKSVQHEGTDYAVYQLPAVPAKVIKDLLEKWPDGMEKIENLGVFRFAMRKKGKGNNPWIVKFAERPRVTVSYGGRGKGGATVAGEQKKEKED